jgi:sugar/nucleoside kinase (ribokinase family)
MRRGPSRSRTMGFQVRTYYNLRMETDRQYDAVVAGYVCIDMTPRFREAHDGAGFSDIFKPGALIETYGLEISLGGAVPNTGIAMKKFGMNVMLGGLVGTDPLGQMASVLLDGHGLSEGVHRCDLAGTAYSIVLCPPGTDRMFLENPGCNAAFSSEHVDYDMVAKGRLFHFGYPPLMKKIYADDGAELETIFRKAREAGAITSLDMTLPDPDSEAGHLDWNAILAKVLPHADIFVPSIEEVLYMMDRDRHRTIRAETEGGDFVDGVPEEAFGEIAERILGIGVSMVLLKAGHKGLYLRTGDAASLGVDTSTWSDKEIRLPAYEADPKKTINACAAGDCAAAGFLTGMLTGEDAETSAKLSAMAGRDNLYGVDGVSGLRDWETMLGDL